MGDAGKAPWRVGETLSNAIIAMGERLSLPYSQINDRSGKLKLMRRALVVIGTTRRDVSVLLTKAPAIDMLPGIVGVVGITALSEAKRTDSVGPRHRHRA